MIVNLFTILIFTLLAQVEMPRKVHLQTQEWPPYQFLEGEVLRGLSVSAVRCAFHKLAIELEVSVVPWNRAQLNTKEGKADGFFAASQNTSRDEYASLSTLALRQNWVWFEHKEFTIPSNQELLKSLSYGAMKGSNMLHTLKEENFNVEVEARSTSDLFKALASRRVARILVSELVAQELEEQKKVDLGIFRKTLFRTHPLGVYFANGFIQKYPKFLSAFNKHFEACAKK